MSENIGNTTCLSNPDAWQLDMAPCGVITGMEMCENEKYDGSIACKTQTYDCPELTGEDAEEGLRQTLHLFC